tara:strand:- start:1727 stop:2179 length:453 start_codon:yes stop_codon:yes gene_type:complete
MSIYTLGSIFGKAIAVDLFGIKVLAGIVEWGLLLGAQAFIINVILSSMSLNSIRSRSMTFFNNVVAGPVIEEIIYRLVLISVLSLVFNSVLLAVVVSAFLFAVGHILWGGSAFINTFIAGLIWGWAFLTFGVAVPIIAHMFHNFIVTILG